MIERYPAIILYSWPAGYQGPKNPVVEGIKEKPIAHDVYTSEKNCPRVDDVENKATARVQLVDNLEIIPIRHAIFNDDRTRKLVIIHERYFESCGCKTP